MNVVVIEEHVSTFPNPISFAQGEKVKLGRTDTEYAGWISVTTANGNEGWAPQQYIEATADASVGITKCSYTAFEMNTVMNEQLEVITELNEWYWVRNSNGQKGWVPIRTVTSM